MIEKIMKAVKSGNKKRGRNITVGTVVGFLLSCTVLMGAEDNYLWIRENSGEIEFNTQKTTNANGAGGNWNKIHPYSDENIWDADTKTYINNMILSSSEENGIDNNGYRDFDLSYGLRLSVDLSEFNFINNGVITGSTGNGYGIYKVGSATITNLVNSGLITGTGHYRSGYGIYNTGGSITNLVNSGLITGIGSTRNDYAYGIYNNTGSSITNLVNNGAITGTGSTGNGHGIYNFGSGSITNLVNSGLIIGTGHYRSGYGIYNDNSITNLENSGLIAGTGGDDYGIYNYSMSNEIGTLTNTGVIFGTTNAIKKISGTINSANNYGILVSGTGDKVVDGISIVAFNSTPDVNKISNYGLAFVADSGNYKNYDNSSSNFGAIYTNKNIDGVNYDIINIGADVNSVSKEITNLKSLGIKDGKLYSNADNIVGGEISDFSPSKQYILNGIEDTLKVIGIDEKNILNNSIINAYKTAIKFDAAGGKLTLSGTIVNGGVDEANKITVSGSSGGDTLILQSGEVEYVGGGTGTQNTVINGNIAMGDGADTITVDTGAIINGNVDMGDGDDVLNIAAGGKINGTLDGGTGSDTLNFGESGTAKTRANTADEINILHDISGFENINVNSNVTLFEKTIGSAGELKDLTVADVSNLTIGANGVLTLRIDSSKIDSSSGTDKIIGHTLYGNTGIIKSENGGRLLLALNGAGNEEIISFGNLALDGSLATGSKGNFDTTSKFHTIESLDGINEVKVVVRWNIPEIFKYKQLNKIYHGIISVDELENFNVDNDEKLSIFLGYLNDIYAGNPYSYSSELSRKSTGMFREIVTENQFKANTGKWMIYGGLTHIDGGTKDTYYGKGYYTYDIGSSDMGADTKITGAYMLGEYGVSDTLTSGVVIGGNKLKSDLSNGSKLDGDALYVGGYVKKYVGNLKVTAGAGFQYGDYDSERLAVNKAVSDIAEPVMKYLDNYNDMTYDIYLNGRYSHNIGDNLFLEPYGTLSYTYIKQDGADEESKALAIETDSKSFDYTSAKAGVDLKKVIPHEKGKSTLSAGVSYTKILDGADEEYITGRFKGENASDFDILVAHKNEHSLGLNAKYALELENGILFDVKGSYAVERDSHNGAGKNKTKGEWIVGAGLGYKF